MSRLIFLSALFLMTPPALAEYRVFQLTVIDETTAAERTVISTFDDIQYPMYHPLKKSETVKIADSWMCWGRTDGMKAFCPKPAENNPEELRTPATQP